MIVRTILGMARSLNYLPIAEGVETEDHALLARDLGCSVLQGYHLAHPMTRDDVVGRFGDGVRRRVGS